MGESYYVDRPDDPAAVYLAAAGFGVRGDGIADDTAAVQGAINRVAETTTRGIVFVPPGTYRLSRTLEIWPGIRVIGYGKTRPVFLLGDDTPGYQVEPANMIHFAGNTPGLTGHSGGAGFVFKGDAAKPAIDFEVAARDASPGTFYSALSNVDLVIGKGNPAAVAVRATYAQHCFLAHIEFQTGSGLAGINEGGNLGEDLHFHGGKFGVMTHTPSPGWQFCLVDATFDGQSVAAIQSEVSGLTLIRPRFSGVRCAVAMSPERGEQLVIKDGRMEDISGPALIIGNEDNARNQISLKNVVCRNVPVFAQFAASGRVVAAPGEVYQVADFSHGLHVTGGGVAVEDFNTGTEAKIAPLIEMPPPVASDIAGLPPQSAWVNVRTLGVKGDGVADDTESLRQAIAGHRTLYFPCGAYRISDTLVLRPDTVLVGLHPGATRIYIDDECPPFKGIGGPVPMIVAPQGGSNIMMGLGIYTNGNNPRAGAVKWMAGPRSLMNDVRFLGGHGTAQLSGEPEPIYNTNHSGDPNPLRHWDSQYPSLWITEGGGGTFMDIWTPSPYAQAGMRISHTSTPGRIYGMSVEHHVRNEVQLEDASNWEIYALQLEEERGESGFAQPLEITRCHDLTISNLFIYRVISSFQPFPGAVRLSNSTGIRFRNFHCWTNSKAGFDNAVVDAGKSLELRQHEFTAFTAGDPPTSAPAPKSSVMEENTGVKMLSGGFFRLAGGAADTAGRFYAADAPRQRIYRWSGPDSQPEVVADAPLDPVNLACAAAGDLLVVSYTGRVYAINPDRPAEAMQVLKAQPAAAHPGASAILPVNYWSGGSRLVKGEAPKCPAHFVSPDGSVFIPANEDFLSGKLFWGVKDHDLLRAYGLFPARPGPGVFITLEADGRTYQAAVDATGILGGFKRFAERGGEAVACDSAGNVFIAEGLIFVYDSRGKMLDVIPVPERPLGLVFGGKDRRTLYIPAGTSLYTVRTRVPGQ